MAEHFCNEHQCKFYKNEKDGKVWYSHKIKDGTGYCNEPKEKPAEVKPPLGEVPLIVRPPATASPDNRFKADPDKINSIEAQNAFKGMIELMVAGIIQKGSPLATDIINYGLQKLGIPIGRQYEVPRKEIEEAIVSSQSQTEPPAAEVEKPKRDLTLIKTGNDLFKVCKADFGIAPQVVLKTLNVESTTEIKNIAEGYNTIAKHFKAV